jgi:hypothetical protein
MRAPFRVEGDTFMSYHSVGPATRGDALRFLDMYLLCLEGLLKPRCVVF